MSKIKEFFKSKAVGFYITAGAALLILITLIAYPFSFQHGWIIYDIKIELFMILGLVLALGLVAGGFFIKGLDNWAPGILAAASFLALLFFALSSVDNVIKVIGEFEDEHLSSMFWVMMIFLGLTLITSIASIFLKQTKAQKS